MDNRTRSRKEVNNAFLKMSLKKAPISKENKEKGNIFLEAAAKKANHINQTTRRDKWQG